MNASLRKTTSDGYLFRLFATHGCGSCKISFQCMVNVMQMGRLQYTADGETWAITMQCDG